MRPPDFEIFENVHRDKLIKLYKFQLTDIQKRWNVCLIRNKSNFME